MPLFLNGLAGAIATLVAVDMQQGGRWGLLSFVAVGIEGFVVVVAGGLFGLYNFWLLHRVKREHQEGLGEDVKERRSFGDCRRSRGCCHLCRGVWFESCLEGGEGVKEVIVDTNTVASPRSWTTIIFPTEPR
jgi:hypothetical protein